MDKNAMVGEEVLKQASNVNTLQEGAGENDALKPKGNFEHAPHLRRALIAQREKHGADTEIGHRISNLIGQTDFLPAAFGEHRKNLEALIAKGTAELAELTGSA